MAFRLYDPEFKTRLRREEIDKLEYNPSWTQVFEREVVEPTYRVEWNSIEEAIKVTRSVTGVRGEKSVIGVDRQSSEMQFFMAEIDEPWVERWMMSQRRGGTLPGTIQSGRREASRLMNGILRDIDDYVWNTVIGWDGTADTLTAAVNTEAGRREFIDTILGVIDAAEGGLAQGRRILAIDSSKLPYFALPYSGAAGGGPSALSVLQQTVDQIVAVQNPAVDDTAVLHFRDMDNAAIAHSTPNGVEVVYGQEMDNKVLRAFHHLGIMEFRGNDTALHTHVIDGL